MKKYISLLVIAILCISLASCKPSSSQASGSLENSINTSPSTPTNNEQPPSTPETPSNPAWPIKPLGGGWWEVFYTHEEVAEFFDSLGGVPVHFVTWDSFEEFGTFTGLTIQDYYPKDPSPADTIYYYFYLFEDAGGEHMLLIESDLERFEAKKEFPCVNELMGNDLRQCETSLKNSYAVYGDAVYDYINGKLYSITWNANGRSCVLSENLLYYPTTETETIIGKLLDSRTAAETIAALNAKLPQ